MYDQYHITQTSINMASEMEVLLEAPLVIDEYYTIDRICVLLEPRFRTSKLDCSIPDVDYMHQLEHRVASLSSKSGKPSQSLLLVPHEWRLWAADKLKAQPSAPEAAKIDIGAIFKELSIDQTTCKGEVQDVDPAVVGITDECKDESEIDVDVAVAPDAEDSKSDDILPDVEIDESIHCRIAEFIPNDKVALNRELLKFVRSCEEFEIFEARNHINGDETVADLKASAALFGQ